MKPSARSVGFPTLGNQLASSSACPSPPDDSFEEEREEDPRKGKSEDASCFPNTRKTTRRARRKRKKSHKAAVALLEGRDAVPADVAPARPGLLADWATEQELAAELRKDPRTLQRWRKLAIGPPFAMVGETIIYHRPACTSWLLAGGVAGAAKTHKRGWS
jgi:hypothetical protein